MNRLSTTAFVLTAALLAGCVVPNSAPGSHIMSGFNDAEFTPTAGQGTAVVQGQAFGKTRGGDAKFAIAEEIRMYPSTRYTEEAVRAAKTGMPPVHDPAFYKFVRRTTSDAQGNFEFTKIPAGTYILEFSMFWETGVGRTGGVGYEHVTVIDGQTAKVMLRLQ